MAGFRPAERGALPRLGERDRIFLFFFPRKSFPRFFRRALDALRYVVASQRSFYPRLRAPDPLVTISRRRHYSWFSGEKKKKNIFERDPTKANLFRESTRSVKDRVPIFVRLRANLAVHRPVILKHSANKARN